MGQFGNHLLGQRPHSSRDWASPHDFAAPVRLIFTIQFGSLIAVGAVGCTIELHFFSLWDSHPEGRVGHIIHTPHADSIFSSATVFYTLLPCAAWPKHRHLPRLSPMTRQPCCDSGIRTTHTFRHFLCVLHTALYGVPFKWELSGPVWSWAESVVVCELSLYRAICRKVREGPRFGTLFGMVSGHAFYTNWKTGAGCVRACLPPCLPACVCVLCCVFPPYPSPCNHRFAKRKPRFYGMYHAAILGDFDGHIVPGRGWPTCIGSAECTMPDALKPSNTMP